MRPLGYESDALPLSHRGSSAVSSRKTAKGAAAEEPMVHQEQTAAAVRQPRPRGFLAEDQEYAPEAQARREQKSSS